jgi:hypothetical protein
MCVAQDHVGDSDQQCYGGDEREDQRGVAV